MTTHIVVNLIQNAWFVSLISVYIYIYIKVCTRMRPEVMATVFVYKR